MKILYPTTQSLSTIVVLFPVVAAVTTSTTTTMAIAATVVISNSRAVWSWCCHCRSFTREAASPRWTVYSSCPIHYNRHQQWRSSEATTQQKAQLGGSKRAYKVPLETVIVVSSQNRTKPLGGTEANRLCSPLRMSGLTTSVIVHHSCTYVESSCRCSYYTT